MLLRDHLGFGTDYLGAWAFLVSANRVWLLAGLASGPVCGVAAGWLGARLPVVWVGVPAGLVLLGEDPPSAWSTGSA